MIWEAATVRFDVSVFRDAHMSPANGDQLVLIAISQRLDHQPMFVSGTLRIFLACDRNRSDAVRLLPEMLDRLDELGIVASREERTMEFYVGAKGCSWIAIARRLIVPPLDLREAVNDFRRHASQHFACGRRLQYLANRVDVLDFGGRESPYHRPPVREPFH